VKQPLVLLHGWGVNALIWDRIIPLLQPGFELTVIDLPGYGNDVEYSGEYSLDAIVNEVLSRAPERANWVGWSLGGTIALAAAISRPERFMKLQLVSSTPLFLNRPDWQYGVEIEPFEALHRDFENDYESAIKKFLLLQLLTPDRSQFKESRKMVRELTTTLIQSPQPTLRTLQHGLNLLGQTDLRTRLSSLTVATQVIAGQHDHIVPSTATEYLFNQLANGHSFQVLQAGHLPFLESPGKYIEALTNFTNSAP
jgi:pimeloyl-[acyl-carrier protein] methyl ester esterase